MIKFIKQFFRGRPLADENGYCGLCHGKDENCKYFNQTITGYYEHGIIARNGVFTARLFAEKTPYHRGILIKRNFDIIETLNKTNRTIKKAIEELEKQ